MRNPLSDKAVQLKPSGIRKFFDLVQEMPDAISLGVGEPDFDTPWHIREEGIYSLEKGRTFYTSNAGLLELRKAIAHYMYRKYELTYDRRSISPSIALAIALKEFKFFISVLVPNSSAPTSRTDKLTSARMEPS